MVLLVLLPYVAFKPFVGTRPHLVVQIASDDAGIIITMQALAIRAPFIPLSFHTKPLALRTKR